MRPRRYVSGCGARAEDGHDNPGTQVTRTRWRRSGYLRYQRYHITLSYSLFVLLVVFWFFGIRWWIGQCQGESWRDMFIELCLSLLDSLTTTPLGSQSSDNWVHPVVRESSQ